MSSTVPTTPMKKIFALCTLGPLSIYVYIQALLVERPATAVPAPAVRAPAETPPAVPGPAAPEGPRLEREGLSTQFDPWPAVGAGPVEARSETLAYYAVERLGDETH